MEDFNDRDGYGIPRSDMGLMRYRAEISSIEMRMKKPEARRAESMLIRMI